VGTTGDSQSSHLGLILASIAWYFHCEEKVFLSFLHQRFTMEQAPVQIGQFVLGKNLGIGAFGKVRTKKEKDLDRCCLTTPRKAREDRTDCAKRTAYGRASATCVRDTRNFTSVAPRSYR